MPILLKRQAFVTDPPTKYTNATTKKNEKNNVQESELLFAYASIKFNPHTWLVLSTIFYKYKIIITK